MARQLGTIQGRGTLVERQDGAAWFKVPGIQGVDPEDGEAPSESFISIDGEEDVITGDAEAGPISIPFVAWQPHHPDHEVFTDAKASGALISLRWTTKTRLIKPLTGNGVTAAISAAGVVTLAGNGHPNFSDVADGHVIQVAAGNVLAAGDSLAVIRVNRLNAAPASGAQAQASLLTKKLDAAIAAGRYAIVKAGLRYQTSGTVRRVPRGNPNAQGVISGTMLFQPTRTLAKPTLVAHVPEAA